MSVDASGAPGHFMFRKTSQAAATSVAGGTDRRLTGTVGAKTTLNGAINNSVTTITVADTTHFPASGEIIIESERITYTGKTGTTFTGCTRGANGTAAASHADTLVVKQYGYDFHFNNLSWVAGGVVAVSGFTYRPGP